MVRQDKLSFRTAHQIVARCVQLAHERHLDLSYDLLQEVAREIINRPINVTIDQVTSALDPENFVKVRGILGGPAPAETRRAVALEREQEQDDEQWHERRQADLENYPQRLRTAVRSFTPTVA